MGQRQLILRLVGRYQFHNRRIKSDVIYSAQFTVRDAGSSRPTRRHRCALSPKHGPLAVDAEPVRILRMHPRSERVQWRHSIARSSSAHSRVCSRLRRSFSFVMTTCPRNSCWSSTRLRLACGCIMNRIASDSPALHATILAAGLHALMDSRRSPGNGPAVFEPIRSSLSHHHAASSQRHGAVRCGRSRSPLDGYSRTRTSRTRPLAPVGCSLNA